MINVKRRFINIDDLNRAASRIQRQFIDKNGDDSLTSLSIPELSEIVYEGEKIALSCRQAMEEKEQTNEAPLAINQTRECIKDIPVSVAYVDGILRIKTPLTFKRMYKDNSLKENYMLMNYVQIALKDYEEKNGLLFDKVDVPIVAIIKRKSNTFYSNKICDNDNLENGRIINSIASALGQSDNVMIMDIYSCFRICKQKEEVGTEFIFTSYDKFKQIVNELDRVA